MWSLRLMRQVIVPTLVGVWMGCGVALAGVAQASALAVRVSPAVRLSVWSPSGDIADYQRVGVAGNGSALVAWSQTVGSGNESAVMVATRNGLAGRWTSPELISDPSISALYPVLAVAPSGAAVVVWEANGPSYSYIEAAARSSARGAWSAPQRLSIVEQNAVQPVVGIDAHGRATAVWSASGPLVGTQIQTARLSLSTGRWSPAAVLAESASSLLVTPEVAVNDSGDVVVVWRKPASGSVLAPSGVRSQVYAASYVAGASRFSKPVVVGSELDLPLQGLVSFEFPGPQVVIDGAGRSMAVWQGGPDPAHVISQVAVEGAPGSAWRAARSPSHGVAIWPHLASDSQGKVTVVWETLGSNGLTDVLQAPARSPAVAGHPQPRQRPGPTTWCTRAFRLTRSETPSRVGPAAGALFSSSSATARTERGVGRSTWGHRMQACPNSHSCIHETLSSSGPNPAPYTAAE